MVKIHVIPCCLSQKEGGRGEGRTYLNETHFSHSEVSEAVIWYCFPVFSFYVSFGMLTYVFFFLFFLRIRYQIFPLFKLLHKKKNQCVVLIAFSSLARSLLPRGSWPYVFYMSWNRASLHVKGSTGADHAALPPAKPLSRISVKRLNAQQEKIDCTLLPSSGSLRRFGVRFKLMRSPFY